jgi:hypothetical protein
VGRAVQVNARLAPPHLRQEEGERRNLYNEASICEQDFRNHLCRACLFFNKKSTHRLKFILIFYPGSKRHRIPDPGSESDTLLISKKSSRWLSLINF